MAIDKLDLCKVIADVLANGQHDAQEVYGMLILLLRLHDKQRDRDASSVSETIEQAFRKTQSLVHIAPVTGSAQSKDTLIASISKHNPFMDMLTKQATPNTILPPTKMPTEARDNLHIRIIDMLETDALSTRQISTKLGVALKDQVQRDIIGVHMRWLQRNGYVVDGKPKEGRHTALWQLKR